MANIDKATSQPTAPTPAQTHEGETSGASPKLASLSKRDSSAEIAPDARLAHQESQKQDLPKQEVPKQKWRLSNLFKGGRPRFTAKSQRRTAESANSEVLWRSKPITYKKVRGGINPSSRFPKLRQAYEAFKALFKKRSHPTVNKALLKENYEALAQSVGAKIYRVTSAMAVVKLGRAQRGEKFEGGESQLMVQSDRQVDYIVENFQTVTQLYESINEKPEDKIAKPDRKAFNDAVKALALGGVGERSDDFLLPE